MISLIETELTDTPRITTIIDNMNMEIQALFAKYNYVQSLVDELRIENEIKSDTASVHSQRKDTTNTHNEQTYEKYNGIDSFMDLHMPITYRTKLSVVSRKIRQITGKKKLRPELEKELKEKAVKYRFVNVHNLAYIEPVNA